MTRVAVIQTAFPGDVILSLPIYQALKENDPACHCAAVVRPESVRLFESNPYVDEIIPFDKYGADRGFNGIARLAAKLRGYDKAVVVQRHIRSAMIAALARIPERIGFDNSSARLLYTRRIKYREDVHEVQRCLDLIGIDNNDKRYRPKIYLSEKTLHDAASLLEQSGLAGEFIVVAPGSVWFTKRYVHYAKLTDLIHDNFNLPVVLLGGQQDRALCAQISETCTHPPRDLSGKTDLLISAAVISKARMAITNDSAPGHIAAAVGTPAVAVFGPTVPSFGFAPYAENSVVVDIGQLYCRPCTRHGSQQCPQGHFRCMKELSPEKIIVAAKSLLLF